MQRWAVCLMVMTIACATAPADAGGKSRNRERLEALAKKIRTEVATPKADRVAQCRAAAFGAKPCGGPWRYVVYSTKVSDAKKLESMIGEYNALEKTINREEGRASDCAFVAEPDVALIGGVCRASATSPPSS